MPSPPYKELPFEPRDKIPSKGLDQIESHQIPFNAFQAAETAAAATSSTKSYPTISHYIPADFVLSYSLSQYTPSISCIAGINGTFSVVSSFTSLLFHGNSISFNCLPFVADAGKRQRIILKVYQISRTEDGNAYKN